jgi:hypothetical protein
MVVPRAAGGVVDESLSGFADALHNAFEAPHIQEHFEKLAKAADADERHLFIPLHDSAPRSASPRNSFSRTRCHLSRPLSRSS